MRVLLWAPMNPVRAKSRVLPIAANLLEPWGLWAAAGTLRSSWGRCPSAGNQGVSVQCPRLSRPGESIYPTRFPEAPFPRGSSGNFHG